MKLAGKMKSSIGIGLLLCLTLTQEASGQVIDFSDELLLEKSKVSAAATSETRKRYIVQLLDLPVVANDATKPESGSKLDPNSPQVRAFCAYLQTMQFRY